MPELPQHAVELYSVVRLYLRDTFREYTAESSKTRGSAAEPSETPRGFFVPYPVRELIAENLVLKRPWYAGFTRLM